MKENINWRMWILALLGIICVVCIVGEPISQDTWFSDLLTSKAIGFASGYIAYRLAIYWNAMNQLSEPDLDKEV